MCLGFTLRSYGRHLRCAMRDAARHFCQMVLAFLVVCPGF